MTPFEEFLIWLTNDQNAAIFLMATAMAFLGTALIVYWIFEGTANVIRAWKRK